MSQPAKKKTENHKKVTKAHVVTVKRKRTHKAYGTSKLEERFAREFLDRLKVQYTYQYKMETIGRYADFRIEPHGPIIEIQGSYWHGDGRLYEEKDLNGTQKHSRYVDELKRKWCAKNGVKLICIWEKDINETPDVVLEHLKELLKAFIPEEAAKKRKNHKVKKEDSEDGNGN